MGFIKTFSKRGTMKKQYIYHVMLICLVIFCMGDLAVAQFDNEQYKNWMRDIICIEKLTLRELTLPGTHDSGTYHLVDTIAPDYGGKDAQKNMDEYLGYLDGIPDEIPLSIFDDIRGLIRSITYSSTRKWGRTQDKNIYDQLASGIRYLDLRVCWKDEEFYIRHGLIGDPIDIILSDVKQFMYEVERELVIIEVSHLTEPDDEKHFKSMTDEHQWELISKIKDSLGDYLYRKTVDNEDLNNMKVSEILKNGPRVIILYSGDSFNDRHYYTPGWPDYLWAGDDPKKEDKLVFYYKPKSSFEEMRNHRQEMLNKHHEEHNPKLFGLSWILTADSDMVKNSMACTIKNEVCDYLEDELCWKEEIEVCIPLTDICWEEEIRVCWPYYYVLELVFCSGLLPDIACDVISDSPMSLEELSKEANPHLDNFVNQPDQHKMNILQVDFFNQSNVVDLAISETMKNCCTTDINCDDGLFCTGSEICVENYCQPGMDPCYDQLCDEENNVCLSFEFCSTDEDCDDGLFCNGQEKCWHARGVAEGNRPVAVAICRQDTDPCSSVDLCDEDNDVCLECLEDTGCDDGTFCNGRETCIGGFCQEGISPCLPEEVCDEESASCLGCLTDEDCNDGLYCNGEEICLDGNCQSGTNPCSNEICDEENDVCLPQPAPLSFRLIPQSVFRSHLIPLPLFMIILSDDTDFDFTTTVSFSNDVITPAWTLVLPPKMIFVCSMITPAGLDNSNSIDVEVTVNTTKGEGIEMLDLIMLPGVLKE